MSIPSRTRVGFSSAKYVAAQIESLTERIASFRGGRLYLEVGGKFLYDGHASRVLPGFDPRCKPDLIAAAATAAAKTCGTASDEALALVMCVSAPDIASGRVWGDGIGYDDAVITDLERLEERGLPRPVVVFNRVSPRAADGSSAEGPAVSALATRLRGLGFPVAMRYEIEGYPTATDKICSKDGFGRDDPVPLPETARLVCVIAVGSNSGKMSTCLGQVYKDLVDRSVVSGYAKYELFPIHNLPLHHPVNLAYEAATADIGDFNVVDPFHRDATGESEVNYNRDVDAYPLLRSLVVGVSPEDSPMRKYRSPTDMGVNCAATGIVDDAACRDAAKHEILSRRERHRKILSGMQAGLPGRQAQVEAIERIDAIVDRMEG